MPVSLFHTTVKQLQPLQHSSMTSPVVLRDVTRAAMERMFSTDSVHRRLFPSGLILRDSQSFSVGHNYSSNIALLLSDGLVAMYAGTARHGNLRSVDDITSISFGTCVPCGVTCDMLRYCIDYYGNACLDTIQHHVTRHLCDIERCVATRDNINTVTCHLYAPETALTESVRSELFDFVQYSLKIGTFVNRQREYLQCVVNVTEDPRNLSVIRHKL